MGAETGARTSALRASLRCSSTAPRAPSRQRARDRPEAAKERSLEALLAELLLHATARRQMTSATEAAQANDFCHFPGDVTNGTARAADVPGCAPVLGRQGTGSTSLALRASLTACGPERGVSDIAEPIRSPRRRVAAGRRRSSSCIPPLAASLGGLAPVVLGVVRRGPWSGVARGVRGAQRRAPAARPVTRHEPPPGPAWRPARERRRLRTRRRRRTPKSGRPPRRRAGCQAIAAAQGRRTRPLEGRAAGPEPPYDAPGAGTNAVVPRGRGAALEAGGAPPRRGSAEGRELVRVGLSPA